jgi:hypothetical protein
VVMKSFARPSSEDPFVVNLKYARHGRTSPPEVAARCRSCALTCGFHCSFVASVRAARRRFCRLLEAPER